MGVRCSYLLYDFGNLGSTEEAENLRSALDSCTTGKDVAILINKMADFQHEEFTKVSAATNFRA